MVDAGRGSASTHLSAPSSVWTLPTAILRLLEGQGRGLARHLLRGSRDALGVTPTAEVTVAPRRAPASSCNLDRNLDYVITSLLLPSTYYRAY
jgi:hypothetical protein